jgi:hypothetical protein
MSNFPSKNTQSYFWCLIALTVGFAVISGCSTAAHEWVEIAVGENGNRLLIDRKFVKRTNFMGRLLSRKEQPDVVYLSRLELAQPEGNKTATESLYGADCSNNRQALLKITEYDINGKVIYSSQEKEYSYSELGGTLPEGSIGYAALKHICNQ